MLQCYVAISFNCLVETMLVFVLICLTIIIFGVDGVIWLVSSYQALT